MPIGYAFSRRLVCLDPVSMATSTTLCRERVPYQPSGHGREPEGAVLHHTEDHPWSLVAHWWFVCPCCRQATSIGNSKRSSKVGLHRVPCRQPKSAKGVKRKALSDEITEKNQKTVQCVMISMTKDADTLSEQAKAQNDIMKSRMRSSGLWRRKMRNMPRRQIKLRNFVRTCKCDQISKCCNFQCRPITENVIQRKLLLLWPLWGCPLMNVGLSVLPCPVKSRPTSGDCHDHLPPGISISCCTA